MRNATCRLSFALLVMAAARPALAADLTLPIGGRVTIELLSSDAQYRNTIALVSPFAARGASGCRLEPAEGLPGLKLVSESLSQRGCRVELDADPATPGAQAFAAGTSLRFAMCSQLDQDPACELVWSSNPALNPDGLDHVRTTPLFPAEFPGRAFQMDWEDAEGNDFNDIIVVVRIGGDRDGDGLWDDWERFGVDTDGDGSIDLNLPALGANPDRRDLFIEVDYMDCAIPGGDCPPGDTHSHRPKAAAMAQVIATFAGAPLGNPDGSTGVSLHLHVDDPIAHRRYVNVACNDPSEGVVEFDVIKSDPANFGPRNPRRFAYRYALFTHLQHPGSNSSGCAELPGNDFVVSLGAFNTREGDRDYDGDGLPDIMVGTVSQQAGTFVHELGHNLGLLHGGGDYLNHKPNYISVMSYLFQLAGIPPLDPDGPGPLLGRIDYSRVALPRLLETSLHEPAGIGGGSDNSFYYCPDQARWPLPGDGPADWNCNQTTSDTEVSSDPNGDGRCVAAGFNRLIDTIPAGDDVIGGLFVNAGPDRTCDSLAAGDDIQLEQPGYQEWTVLEGWNDWVSLRFPFHTTFGFIDGDTSTRTEAEIDHATYLEAVRANLAVRATASPAVAGPGSTVTLRYTVTNRHPEGARLVRVDLALPRGLTLATCTSTHGGTCDGPTTSVSLPALGGGETAVITLTAAVACGLPQGIRLQPEAQATLRSQDPDMSDNTAPASIEVRGPPSRCP
jgi:hypothetical protein